MLSVNKISNNQTSANKRYHSIKYSGYVSTISMAVCCLSGLKKVKIPYKRNIHKVSGILALLSTIWHIGAIKQWDKIFRN